MRCSQESEVKNPERVRKSTNLLKMNSVKGIFQEYFTGRKMYSLLVLLDV